MKTILIPTDFSKNAYCALHYATQLFAEEKCRFIIVHSFENQVTNLTSRIDIGKTEAVVEELYSTNEANCDEIKRQITVETQNTNHTFKTIATSISLHLAINRLIVKEHVDFVVMGNTGKSGAKNILIGSNTLKMIQRIKKAPLLVIPRGSNIKPIKKIAFATGFKRSYTKNELEPLIYMSSYTGAAINVIHTYKKNKKTDSQHANFNQLFEILEMCNPENNWLNGEADTHDSIITYLNKEHINLLVMIYYKHNAIVRLFREATIKDIAKYTLIPFLILPAGD